MSVSNIDTIATAVYEMNPIVQFAANPGSRAAAIKAKCAKCFGCTSSHL